MILGIVGSEQAKFTPETEECARYQILSLIVELCPSLVVSGECHLGGVDTYARESAQLLGIPFKGFALHV